MCPDEEDKEKICWVQRLPEPLYLLLLHILLLLLSLGLMGLMCYIGEL